MDFFITFVTKSSTFAGIFEIINNKYKLKIKN